MAKLRVCPRFLLGSMLPDLENVEIAGVSREDDGYGTIILELAGDGVPAGCEYVQAIQSVTGA